jgi:H+/Cl- antiporter ClcA
MVYAVALGLVTGVFGVLYLLLTEWLSDAIWGDEPLATGWFSGDISNLLIPVIAGLVVGAIYQVFRLPSRYPGFIEDLKEGMVDPKTTVGAIVIAVFSLISGPSVGPEAPLGAAGGAVGTWAARLRGAEEERVRQMSFVGISGAFGGLLATPVGGPLLAFELEHEQTQGYYYAHIVPGVIAGAVSFGIMWPILGAPFQGLIELDVPVFESWMLLAAVALGLTGAIAAFVVGKIMVAAVSLMRPLDGRPMVRGVLGGVAVGMIAFAMPLTMFSGQTALPVVIDGYAEIGVAMLLALALLKALALGVSLGGGFFGGPIFPMFFIGATLGIAVHLLVPSIPIALAVGCVMAAVSAAIALLPLSMAVLASIMIESGLQMSGAIALASVTGYAVRVAIMLARQSDMEKAAAPVGS